MLQRVEQTTSGKIEYRTIDPKPEPAKVDPPRSGSELTEDMRAVLQQRMAILWPFGALIIGSVLGLLLWGVDSPFAATTPGPRAKALLGLTLAAFLAGSIVTRAVRVAPLRWLRIVEVTTLVAIALTLTDMRVDGLRVDSPNLLNWFVLYNSFGWLTVILVECIAVPGTAQRARVYVIILSLIPFAIDAAFLGMNPERWRSLIVPELVTIQVLGFAAVLALFGSHKIESLRQAVVEAKREIRAARALGPYILKRQIGAGGMGEVYLAEHRLLKRTCAVKLIRSTYAADPDALARFEREAQATAKLRHPNTVEVFDFGRTDEGDFFYIMEYLDGLNLSELVSRHGPMPPGRVIAVLRPLCGALGEAHAAGLVHRDIKPNNILLCRHGGQFDVVKLLDFGIVRGPTEGEDAVRLTQVGTILGTPEFMSPEQAGSLALDFSSDIYSLGATAFFLLTGKAPFESASKIDVLFAHRSQPVPTLPPEVPADLAAIVARCLAKKPAERFASMEDVDRALRGCTSTWSPDDAKEWWSQAAMTQSRR